MEKKLGPSVTQGNELNMKLDLEKVVGSCIIYYC